MNTLNHFSPDRLAELIACFHHSRIAVMGDFFLDKYLDVDPQLAEYSIETGKTAHQVSDVRHWPGAAGTVVSNLAALGAGVVHAIGMTGDDGESYDLRADLRRLGCSTDHLHVVPERRTPTYLKPRDAAIAGLAGEHSRYDTKNRLPLPAHVEMRIVESLDALLPEVDGVIALDQVEEAECGVITTAVRRALADRAAAWPDVVFWADSRRRIRDFRRVIIKPNQFEAMGIDNPPPGQEVDLTELRDSLVELRALTAAPICVTRSTSGMLVTDPRMTLVPGLRVDGPTDPTGAGDSVTAGAVLTLTSGGCLPEAAVVGTLVASITVEQLDCTGTACAEQLPARLETWLEQRGHNG